MAALRRSARKRSDDAEPVAPSGPSCDPEEPFIYKWGGLIVLSLALAIILIDVTLLNVSLKAIIEDLNTDIQKIQWVITAYSLTLAALTITGGRLGDLFGRKRMFMLGALIFGIGSFIASISQSVPQLIVGESIIEGVGAALMLPATASLLISKFRGRDRAIAFGVWGGVAGASTAIGPLLGGWLTTNYSWRWGFRINVFVVAILLAGSFLIAECYDKEEKPTLDWIGVLLSSTGLFALVFGIIESSSYGWWTAKKPFTEFGMTMDLKVSVSAISIAIGLVLLALFVLWERHVERRGRTPLVSLELFANRQFSAGMTTTAVTSMGQTGLIFSIPVFLQAVQGYDAFHTGLALVPSSIAAFFAAPAGAALSQRIPARYIIQGGLVLNAISYVVLRQALNINATAADLAPGLVLQGIGLGLVLAQINNVTLSAVSVQQAGEAAGVNNTGRQLGSTLGTAIIGAVLLSTISAGLVTGLQASKVIPPQFKDKIATSVSQQSTAVEFGGGAVVGANVPVAIKDEITRVSHESITGANKKVLLLGSFIALAGVLVSFGLPKGKDFERSESVAHRPDGDEIAPAAH
jgi:EmrB/QacA subfamily drug resistance transporter